MRKPKFQNPSGMHDILPEEQKYFQKIYNTCESIANFYRFDKIDTPVIEDTELFSKGIGLATEIVGKQMYSFRSRGGDYLTLRPEGTAPVMRAYIEHGMINLPQPIKLWYFCPFFRYEKPQAGRYRQFWQFGFEVIGEGSPVIDAQIIQIFYNILNELKFKNLIVEINSIGDNQCRPYYKKLLVSYFRSRESALCADCRRRLRENPLRILDCKEEKCQRLISQAPQMIDHLCEECHAHFKEVLEFLDEIGLPYRLNPHLVRGLDYYAKTVFEIFEEDKSSSHALTGARASEESEGGKTQGSLAGGGRYDNLVKILGGKDAPGCGAACGIDRVVNLMQTKAIKLPQPPPPEIYLAQLGGLAKRKSLKLIEEFRKAKIQVAESLGRDSLKAQFKMADRLGAKYALILGQKEALEGTIIIRDMVTGRQDTLKLDKVIAEIKKRLQR